MSLQLKGYSFVALSVTEECTHQVHAFTFIYTHLANTLVPFLIDSKSNSGSGFAGALHEQRTEVGTEYEKLSLEKGQDELLETQHQGFDGFSFLLLFIHKSVRTKPKQDVYVH